MAELAIRTIDCRIVAMVALGYGGPWLWWAVTVKYTCQKISELISRCLHHTMTISITTDECAVYLCVSIPSSEMSRAAAAAHP